MGDEEPGLDHHDPRRDDAFRYGSVQLPDDWLAVQEPLLTAAGVKNWRSFVNGSLLVVIDGDGESLVVTPTKNKGPRDGFEELEDRQLILSATVTDKRLGEAVIAALESSA